MIKLQGNRWYTSGSREDYIEAYKINPYKVRFSDPKLKGYTKVHQWCYENIKGTFSAIVQPEINQMIYDDCKEDFVQVVCQANVWYYFSDKDEAILFKLIWS